MSFKRKFVNPSLKAALESWRELDKSEESRQELEQLVESLTEEELEKKFLIRVSFGTAEGMRGVMGPGYNCINDVTIQQTSQGYCAYLVDRFGADGKERGVVIGFDGRYNSENFAHLAAAVFLSAGVKVRLSSKVIATPVVAYAVQKFLCIGGIVITGSHEPQEYNGYKVFTDNGAQILPPLDSDISAWITRSLALWKEVEALFDRRGRRLSAAGEKHARLERVFDSVVDLYVEDIAADLASTEEGGKEAAIEEEKAATKIGEQEGKRAAIATTPETEERERRSAKAAADLTAAAAASFAVAGEYLASATQEGPKASIQQKDKAAASLEAAAAAAEEAAAAGARAAAAAEAAAEAAAADLSAAAEEVENEKRRRQVRVVYTALHGVGSVFVQRMLRAFKFPGHLILVTEQCTPDPDFPTVGGLPNLEAKHVLGLAMETANFNGATLVVANDADAERFLAAEKHAGSWLTYTGDELGVLLGAYAMKLREAQGIPKERMAFIASAVTSRMVEKMANRNGCYYAETLTGFQWMEAKALELSAAGYFPVLLCEEALGYAVSNRVRDKDGISALALFLQCAVSLHEEGRQVQDFLLELRRLYGYFASQNSYFVCSSNTSIPRFFHALSHSGSEEGWEEGEKEKASKKGEEEGISSEGRESGEKKKSCHYPEKVGSHQIVRVRDVARRYDSQQKDCRCALPPHEEMVSLYLDNGAVLTLRGTGTERRLKYFAEASASTPHQGREMLDELIEAFIQEFIKPREELFLNVPS